MKTPVQQRLSWAVIVLVLLAVAIRLFYWYYTDRTWEDALITVQHSESAAQGHGLTHPVPPGERPLHGFTSPLSVLVPLVGDSIKVGYGLVLIKAVSAILGGVAVVLGALLARQIGLSTPLTLTFAAYLAFEHHQVLWGMAGMETEIVTVAYLWSIYCVIRGTQWQKGLSLGLTMLARPDAAFWVVIVLVFELIRIRRTGEWRELAPIIAGLTLLYAPWLVFATLYYGSPIPNTIIAKGLGYRSVREQIAGMGLVGTGTYLVERTLSVFSTLGPVYGGNGTGFLALPGRRVILFAMALLAAVGLAVAWRRRDRNMLIVFSFAIVYGLYLGLAANAIFGWYTAPIVPAMALGCWYGFDALLQKFAPTDRRVRLAAIAGIAYLLPLLIVLPRTFSSDRAVQELVENGNRKQIGLYLASVSAPSATIASESLGYVGYYSRRVIYDYPGLCSRPVVSYLRAHPKGRDMLGMMESLRPDYLVLRPPEFRAANGTIKYPWLANDYELVRVFRVPEPERDRIMFSSDNVDLEFAVFRKRGTKS